MGVTSFVSIGRTIQHPAVLREAGAVTGTVPGVLLPVVLQGAAHVGTPGRGGGQEVHHRVQHIHRQLGAQDGPLGIEQHLIAALPALYQVRQQRRRRHGPGHAPLVEPGGGIQPRRVPAVLARVGHPVQRHTVLGRPAADDLGLGIVPPGRVLQSLPAAALFPVRWPPPPSRRAPSAPRRDSPVFSAPRYIPPGSGAFSRART